MIQGFLNLPWFYAANLPAVAGGLVYAAYILMAFVFK
jgi:hypothetical protein